MMNSSDKTGTNQREYKSLHEYLDRVFAGCTPSAEEIIREKKNYWRKYNTELKQQQRQKYKSFTISLTTDEYRKLKKRLAKKQSVIGYIRQMIQAELYMEISDRNTKSEDRFRTEQLLFAIVDFLEVIVFGPFITDDKSISILKEHLEHLRKRLDL